MVEIELNENPLTVELTADSPVSDKEVVGAVAQEAVAPIDDTTAQSVVGVANNNAQAGEAVEVVVLGKKKVIADGAVGIGEPVKAAAATAGRVESETAIPAAHTHTMPTHQHSVPTHTHTMPTHSHTALQSDGADAAPAAHQAMTDGGATASGLLVGVSATGQAAETIATSTDNPGDTNAAGPGSTAATDPGDTNSADPGPAHGRTFGKALSSAAAAGDEITVLVSMTA